MTGVVRRLAGRGGDTVVALGSPVGDRSVVDGSTGAPHPLEG